MKFLSATLFTLFLIPSAMIQATEKPNIIFILIDDLGRQDLGIYGSEYHQTPNIDQLAADGALFNNAYAAHTVCRPSRTAIFSGRYPVRYGIPGFQDYKKGKHAIPLEDDTFADELLAAGYKTGYIGKWHVGKVGGEPDKQGFAYSKFAGGAGQPMSFFSPYQTPRNPHVKVGNKDMSAFINEPLGKKDEFLPERINSEALKFIKDNKESPFLLVVSHYAVHIPTEAKKGDIKLFEERAAKLGLEKGDKRYEVNIIKDKTGEYKSIQNQPVYAAQVKSIDESVGKVVSTLQELGLEDNTIIILSSDHGGFSSRGHTSKIHLPATNLPYRHGKGWVYDGGIRVPLIVKWPSKIKAKTVTDVQATGTDHYPSILEMAGLNLSPENHKDGVSYLAAAQGDNSPREAMYWHSPIPRPHSMGDTAASAMIDGDWKIIQWHDEKTIEVYNLINDKEEKHNLYDATSAKSIALNNKLNAWKTSVNARLKTK